MARQAREKQKCAGEEESNGGDATKVVEQAEEREGLDAMRRIGAGRDRG